MEDLCGGGILIAVIGLFLSVSVFKPQMIIFQLMAIAVFWGFVSTWFWMTNFSKLGGAVPAQDLLLGPRPEDPVEQKAWWWARQFRFSMMAIIGLLVIAAFVIWITEE